MNRGTVIIMLILLAGCAKTADPAREEWVQLFNGKDLSGWDLKIAGYDLNDNFNNTFRVEAGALQVDYSGYKHFNGEYGHIYYHRPYSYYRVRLEYRFTGNQVEGGPGWAKFNNGIMVHSQSAMSVEKDQSFPVSLEMQLLGSDDVDKRHTGNLCTPGTEVYLNGQRMEAHCTDSDSKFYPADQWVTAEAIVMGDSVIHHVINGDTVLSYERPHISDLCISRNNGWIANGVMDSLQWIQQIDAPMKKGYIALQAESHPVEFRNIELLNLKGCMDPKALNYKSYYVKSDQASCRYK